MSCVRVMESFDLMASRFNYWCYLASRSGCYPASVFSLVASNRARCCSLVPAEAGRPSYLRLFGVLSCNKRELSITVLCWFVIVFAAWEYHVS